MSTHVKEARWRVRLYANDRVIHEDEGVGEPLSPTYYSLMYNSDISGGCRWRHPRTGELFPHGVQYELTMLDRTKGVPDDLR